MNVTDHAVLRCIERIHEFPVERLRREIAKQAKPYLDLITVTVPIFGGTMRAVIKDNTVITILPPKRPRK